jgi:hypothetical protein
MQLAQSLLTQAQLPIHASESATVTASADTLVTQIILCNTSASTVTVRISLTNSGASSTSAANRIFHELSMTAQETIMLMPDLFVPSGYKVWASASTGSVVNAVFTGVVSS